MMVEKITLAGIEFEIAYIPQKAFFTHRALTKKQIAAIKRELETTPLTQGPTNDSKLP
jgi:hypothetical protein